MFHYKFREIDKEILSKLNSDKKFDNYPIILKEMLAMRDYSRIDKFLPYDLLDNAKEGAEYLFKAIKDKKKMCIIADYDVDGATSCAIMYSGLKFFGADINYYVPDRFKHGYGLQKTVIDDMLLSFPDNEIIITVDNGIASIDGVNYANDKNMEVLVTDHHLQGEELPDAVLIINPNKNSDTFPSKALAGCGVAFYVMIALRDVFINKEISKINSEIETELNDKVKKIKLKHDISFLLDYLAIGTVADVVSLDENNRLIVETGLNRIKTGKANVGIKALCNVKDIDEKKITTSDIGFKIGPVLNAAGRLKNMSLGIDLLLSDSIVEANAKAIELNNVNIERKAMQKEMREKVIEDYENEEKKELEKLDFDKEKFDFSKVFYNPTFHEGIIGILASNIKDMFYLPAIVFSDTEDVSLIKGSGRSINEIHLRDAIDYVFKKDPSIISKFGGHSMAAGLSIYKDKLNDFQRLFDESCKLILNGEKPVDVKLIDMNLNLNNIDIETVELINSQIWGQNFKPPLFIGQFSIIDQKILKGQHLKLQLKQKDSNYTIDAMYFFKKEMIEKTDDYIDVSYTLNINTFLNKKTIQLFVDSI